MDPIETVEQLERQYRQILELTREQEECLCAGRLAELPPVLTRKAELVADAQHLLGRLKATEPDRTRSGFQEALGRLGSVMAQVVAAEERCQDRGRPPPAAVRPSRNRAIAAYSGGTGRDGPGSR